MNNDYIRREDAVDYCKALMNAELVQHTDDWGYGKERYNQTEVILNFIENRQPADVVPVVRCKECIHHHYESKDISYCDRIDYGYGWKDNDFCSRGERKE